MEGGDTFARTHTYPLITLTGILRTLTSPEAENLKE
jgi:hypothetical protein